MNNLHSNFAASIRYGLWIVLQIALGLLSTVVLYRVLCLMMWNFNVSSPNPNGIESWIHSPFANRQMHAVALSILSFIVGESILKIPVVVLDRNRWLVLFSLVFIFTSYDLFSSEVAHHKIDFTDRILIPYWLLTVMYLFQFQWRFIPEGAYYDLLLGPVALYGFNQGMICMFI